MCVRRARITPAFRPFEPVPLSKLSGARRAIPSIQSGPRNMASASAHNAISQPIRNARSKSSIRSHDAGRPDSLLRSIKQRTPHMVQKRSLLAISRGANDCHTAVSGSDHRLVWLRNMLRTQILPLALALLVVSKRASLLRSCLSSSLLGILPTTTQPTQRLPA